ncbi:DUF4102 domain-containing protein [Serratia fonticola]|uniref:tyrosine-type recombinase/integrase n=1 Tax=Serratia fonticola TaxID=47917 RepID=UPI001576E072|nr:integrase arm-type DNA-binding domain-containing protein [Serratia fonticola]NTY86492.1 DUF4102 domain-containing protein [Serratia fonticola]NTZ12377.1 DUF4102 domain-containing protein [Serratia fonticola]
MRLTEQAINQLQTEIRSYKKFDGGGLFIHVMKSGARYWRYKYTLGGEDKLLTLGTYPAVSLAQARERHAEAHSQVVNGIDPNQSRKIAKLAKMVRKKITFQQAASVLYQQRVQDVPGNKEQFSTLMARLERDVFPYIGARPVLEITPVELITVLLRKEQISGSTPETQIIRNFCADVIRAVIIKGDAHMELMPVSPLAKPENNKVNMPTLAQFDLVGFFTALLRYQGSEEKLLAIRLLIMTGVTVGELRAAAWTEFDFDEGLWVMPAERSNTGEVQYIPLSTQARDLIEELKKLTGFGMFLFPSRTAPQHPVSEASLEKVLVDIGYGNKISVRSFSLMMRKILTEQGAALTQIDTQVLSDRGQLLQAYADVIEAAERGSSLVLGKDTFCF